MALDETSAKLKGSLYGTFYLDLKKFYDSLDLSILIRRAMQLNYPAVNLYMTTLIYLAPRVIRACHDYSLPICPWNGIVAGCGSANHAARAMLYVVLEITHNASPLAITREFVGDLHTRVEGRPEEFQEQLPVAVDTLVQACLDSKLVVSGKSALLTNCEKTKKHIIKQLKMKRSQH